MSDLDLRTLERDALAQGDTASWKRYYQEKRRIGQGLPSGMAEWTFDLREFERAQVSVRRVAFQDPRIVGVDFDVTMDGASSREKLDELVKDSTAHYRARFDLVDAIELEWKRCGTGVPLQVQVPGVHGQCPVLTVPWQEAIFSPMTAVAEALIGRTVRLAGSITRRDRSTMGLDIRQVAEHLWPEFRITAPEFLAIEDMPPAVMVIVGPSREGHATPLLRLESGLVINPDAVTRPVWVAGVRSL